MSARKKVLFLINSLGGGGAERVLVNLVNNMDKTKFDITVQTMFSAGVNKEFLASDIKFIESNAPYFRGCSRVIKIIPSKWLYKYFIKEKYDVIIAFMHGAPSRVIAGCKDKATAKIAWLHTDMRNSSLPKFFSNSGIIKTFKTFDKIVGVSKTVSDSFIEKYGLSEKVTTKYNTNDVNKILALSEQTDDDYYKDNAAVKISTVGRLSQEKGYERLIDCCNRLAADNLSFELLIIGSGPKELALKQKIEEYNLQNTVRLVGFKTNPYSLIKQSDLFVCSSYQEGLSTAISEAIILGVPVISTEVSGAKEVLGENNEYGVVVDNNDDSLYEGMKKLITDLDLLAQYRDKAKQRSSFFDVNKTVGAVEELIEEVAKCNH